MSCDCVSFMWLDFVGIGQDVPLLNWVMVNQKIQPKIESGSEWTNNDAIITWTSVQKWYYELMWVNGEVFIDIELLCYWIVC